MQAFYNRYTIDEVRTCIEEMNKRWLESEGVEIEIEIQIEQNEERFLFEVYSVEEGTLINFHTIQKTEEDQGYVYSTIDFIGTSLHEVIKCVRVESSHLFVYIKKVKDKESTQFFLDSLERRKEEGEISHENYEWYKKIVQTLRLRNVF